MLTYEKEINGLVVSHPYNDFISEGGKIWDRIRAVAEANHCVSHMLQVLNAASTGNNHHVLLGNELVSTLADLASSLFEAHIVAELNHGFLPCERVEIHRVQQRAVQVEDSGFRH